MTYQWDNFSLDTAAFRLDREGQPVALEPKALDVLALLVARAGQLVTKQEILDAVWPRTAVTDYALTRVIAQLRKALGDEAREAKFIETVPTRGYRWIRPLTPLQPPASVSSPNGPSPHADHPHVAARVSGLAFGSWLRRAETALVAIVIAIVGVAYLLNGGTNESTAGSVVDRTAPAAVSYPEQLTTGVGVDLQPTISPHGDAIAFVSDRTGALEIYVRALAGAATETPLTSDGAQNTQPAWSPDGASIAYHSISKGGIWIVPARGGVPRQISPVGAHPAWSPDGMRIAFQTDEFTEIAPNAFPAQVGSVLRLVNVSNGAAEDLTTPGKPMGGHGSPAWSPDGRFVAFVVFEGGDQNGLWQVSVGSGALTRLAVKDVKEVAYDPCYAHDGSAIFAAGGREAIIRRFPIDATTGEPRGTPEIIPIPGVSGIRGLSLSKDGTRLVFAGLWLDSQIWAAPVTPEGIATSAARALTKDRSARNLIPAISPDGKRIAFMSRRQGQPPNISVMNPDGSNAVQLTSDEASEFQPNWFPDSQRIAYLSNRDNRLGVWTVDITTRREELLLDATRVNAPISKRAQGEPIPDLRLSPSAKDAVFAVMTPPYGRRALEVMSMDDVTPRRVTDGSASVSFPTWSPDGKQIAASIKDGTSTLAAVVDVASGRLLTLTAERGRTWPRGWSPDSRKVAVVAYREGQWSMRWIDTQTKREGIIIPPVPPNVYVRYPDWSARGDLIVFERGETGGNIWSIRLNR